MVLEPRLGRLAGQPAHPQIGHARRVLLLAWAAAALGVRALAGMAGWSDADGNAMALLLLPLLWGILAFWLLMLPRRRSQYTLLAFPAAAGLGLIFVGGAL